MSGSDVSVLDTDQPGELWISSLSEPLRGTSFSLEHFEEHARVLARVHVTHQRPHVDDGLWRRFEDNAKVLERAYQAIVAAVEEDRTIMPGAEWLLDNYYIVREQLREIRHDLPKRYYRELPKLSTGSSAGRPRAYALALEIISHCDSALDDEMLARFVNAYQQEAPLTIGELWAIPIMLRVGLIENLRRLADQVVSTLEGQQRVDLWIDSLNSDQDQDALAFLVAQTRDTKQLSSSMVMRLVQRCRDQGQQLAICWQWLEQHMSAMGESIDDVVRLEHQRQACNQVSTGNAITSMRLLSALDWGAFVERVSLVDQLLRQDPAGAYEFMDFATRDRYRHVIERMAKRARVNETEVARRAIQLSRDVDHGTSAMRHVGYFLIDDGRRELEGVLKYRPPVSERLRRCLAQFPTLLYLGSIMVVTLVAESMFLAIAAVYGASAATMALVALVALIPVTELAVSLVNFTATKIIPPGVLPKMEFKEGIPEQLKTIVVMPTLMLNKEVVRTLVEKLEIHYLANPEANLVFALLSDLPDAPQQQMPDDDLLVAEAASRIRELNDRYPGGNTDRFWLFYRTRQWNPAEGQWMAWERKRGKISEFNRLLRGARDTSYVLKNGFPADLLGVKYVITLDADTKLPPGSAKRLIGTIAHPLNRALTKIQSAGRHAARIQRALAYERGEAKQPVCIERGYAILQPRVGLHVVSARQTPFARIFSGNPHLDPYVTAVSDVYQDCFGEGSYIGKGIYDVDAFEAIVGGAFPDNHILSHDLIESCHARAGLVTDIELFDDFPPHYHAYARRQHRWARGDWQLLPWLFRRVPTRHGSRRNPLSILSRWKVLDNLRRSLVAPALLVFLLVAWFVLPGPTWIWTLPGLAILCLPLLFRCASTVLGRPRGVPWVRYLREQGNDLRISAVQAVMAVAFLVDQAMLMLDAISRTLVRMFVTHHHLLEWESAAATEKRFRPAMLPFVADMWTSPTLACALAVLIAWQRSHATLLTAAPVLLMWLAAPLIAFQSSKPIHVRRVLLTAEERQELRDLARRIWSFFETFVNEQEQWLPPDNYQEDPKPVIAHRTSPTNEGLYLVSALGARDLGYVGLHELVDRLELNLDHWSTLDHYRGHPHNWYDTRTGRSLSPAYISTVDSGNLGVCLLTLRQGLLELIDKPVMDRQLWNGLADALRLDCRSAKSSSNISINHSGASGLGDATALWAILSGPVPNDLYAWHGRLDELSRLLAKEADDQAEQRNTNTVPDSGAQPLHATLERKQTQFHHLAQQVDQCLRDLRQLCPWVSCGNTPCEGLQSAENNSVESEWASVCAILENAASLGKLANLRRESAQALTRLADALNDHTRCGDVPELVERLGALRVAIDTGSEVAKELSRRLRRIAERCHSMVAEMDFSFLYNPQRRLFSIGYNVSTGQLDRSHYDLLASESRLASLLAIGKGDTGHQHWFHLGRPLTRTSNSICLLSWGGTMFEYLMPSLFLRGYPETLLDQSCRAAVDRQVEFGRRKRLPWGISESAFAALDGSANYQYQSFGVPGLGLKRGLSDQFVVSPYSTALALAVHPRASLANFRELARRGAMGQFGFYEAVDFTGDRLPRGASLAVVRCYMAHHQGMTLTSIVNCLLDSRMQHRFHSEATTKAVEMLLQERVPIGAPLVEPHRDEMAASPEVREMARPITRWITTPDTSSPRTHMLSNGNYAVMITNAGGGYSSCDGVQITRWRPDTVRDGWGQFVYVRDLQSHKFWSAGFQPTLQPADGYKVLFSVDKAEFQRNDGDIETHMEIAVSPEHNAEVRQLTITNHGSRPRHLDVTSYAEVVITTLAADVAHPAFQKLFVQTEFLADNDTLLAMRRPRGSDEQPLWAIHTVAFEHSESVLSPTSESASPAQSPTVRGTDFETDRARFVGRGRTPASPAAMLSLTSLGKTTGAVLDPVFSLRRTVRLEPGQAARLAFTTAVAKTREEALALADQYRDLRVVLRVFELAWAHSQVELRHRHLIPADAHLYQRLASHLIYPDNSHRAPPSILAANRQGQSALWRHGISGDYPIILVRINHPTQEGLVREMLLAHEYWRAKCFTTKLVFLNEHPSGYVDEMQEQLQRLIGEGGSWTQLNKPGGICILHSSMMTEEDRILLQAAAHVVLNAEAGNLSSQLDVPVRSIRMPARLSTNRPIESTDLGTMSSGDGHYDFTANTLFWNGLGGFSLDGREYIIVLQSGQWTPAPWCNIIANPSFGCLVSESGSGITWAENSRENKLTTWSNDPVSDNPGEAIYVRDDETGEFWSPTPLPVRGATPYVIRHGRGYSRFEHIAHDIAHDLLISIATSDPVKFSCLKLRNQSRRRRRLSVTYCAEWVLGVSREQTQMHVVTKVDEVTGALIATNCFHPEFNRRTAFVHALGGEMSLTGDRCEFFGRNGTWSQPNAMARVRLSGRTGAGLDPCGAVQVRLGLEPGEETELVFLLGQTDDYSEAQSCLARYHSSRLVHAEIDKTCSTWDQLMRTVQVKTPNPALDVLVNHWLLYQVISSRLWARTALYQCSGAYGFRDQLQDVMAVVYSRRDLAREHILRAARRQYEAGDVQHWWHVPTGRGIRARYSDDALWLPFVVDHYVRTTGDKAILDEALPFLRSPSLDTHEQERYEFPEISPQVDTLYGHCLRAIDRSLRFGVHGLPLMGCGDWNDGMNHVGREGRGESVWLAWFLVEVLNRFAAIVTDRGENQRAAFYQAQSEILRAAVERNGWDGEDGRWYRRAYFDDGTPLGSRKNDECQIDSLPQSWAVIAGGNPDRCHVAMQSVVAHLVRFDQRLVRLFAPAFENTSLDPGYVKGYVPGIRENGGQYTHAALWVAQAMTRLEDGDQAMALFDLLNPIHHSDSPQRRETYKVEPYVVAADVYSRPPHEGRGGWTWYTGSAGWMYRVALESILGFQLRGDHFRINPCIPTAWERFELTYRYGATTYHVVVDHSNRTSTGMTELVVDNQLLATADVPLRDDGGTHQVVVRRG
jgi:cyclic beta-1,2-glucan synthetase